MHNQAISHQPSGPRSAPGQILLARVAGKQESISGNQKTWARGPWLANVHRKSQPTNRESGIRNQNSSTARPSTPQPPAPRSLHIFLILHPPPDTCIIDRFGAPRSFRFSSSFGRGWQAPERAQRPAKRMTQDSRPGSSFTIYHIPYIINHIIVTYII